MIYTTHTTQKIEIIKKELEEKAKVAGFGVLNVYEFKKILNEKNVPIEKDITVFELCNPTGAQQVLSELSSVSVYLPCRLSVYEEDGVTTLSTIGFDDILKSIEVDQRFQSFMEALFRDIKSVMHSWEN